MAALGCDIEFSIGSGSILIDKELKIRFVDNADHLPVTICENTSHLSYNADHL